MDQQRNTNRGPWRADANRKPGSGAADFRSAAPRAAAPAPPAEGGPPRQGTSVEDLNVFRLAHELAVRVHGTPRPGLPAEGAELLADLRRDAAAVPAQLAVGAFHAARDEYRRHVLAARAAAVAVRYRVLLARDLGWLPAAECEELRDRYDQTCRMLTKFAQALERPAPDQK
jgi:four helix bundle protein